MMRTCSVLMVELARRCRLLWCLYDQDLQSVLVFDLAWALQCSGSCFDKELLSVLVVVLTRSC